MHKNKTILIAMLTAGSLLTGCTSPGKGKEIIDQALDKQKEMTAYSFSGTADIDLTMPPAAAGSNPATATLLSIMKKSKLEWTGASQKEPVRFEADLKSTPAGSSSALELPMLFMDNKMYINIPLLNKKDEYFSIDLAAAQQQGLSPDSLKNTSQSASDIAKLFISDLDPKWFKEAKDPVKLADGKNGTVVTMDITEKNKKDVSSKLQAKFPAMIDVLSKNGLISAAQADQMKKVGSQSFQVKAPGSLSVTKDDTGFIREEKLTLDYTSAGADGQQADHHIHLTQAYNDINQQPKFTKEVPKTVRPFEDVLKLLAPQPSAGAQASPAPHSSASPKPSSSPQASASPQATTTPKAP